MIRSIGAVLGALMLFASCDNEPAEAPATPAAQAPAAPATPAPAADPAVPSGGSFTDAVGQFNPATQHFVWVLPEGVHGKAPWEMNVTVKHRGEVKYKTVIPLKADLAPPGSRPEFPATSETVRLSDDGSWISHMTEVKKVIDDLIARFGRGEGELLMDSELKTSIDDAHRKAYCEDHQKPVVHFYLEEGDKLTAFDLGPMAPMFEASILKGCKA